MPLYERVDHTGHVVERVETVDGSAEDTRLGIAVLDGVNGWRVPSLDPEPQPQAEAEAELDPDAADEGQATDAPATDKPPRPARARAATKPAEEH